MYNILQKGTAMKIMYIWLLSTILLDAQIYQGEWLHKSYHDGRTDYTPIRFYSEKKEYTNGSILFNFPANYFNTNPHVVISIQTQDTEYLAHFEYNAFITELSPMTAKIRVTKNNKGIINHFITEANSGDVTVTLLAYGY